MKWTLESGAVNRTSPALDGKGLIYFGTDGNVLYVIDGEGDVVNKKEFPGRIRGAVAIGDDGTIYVGTDDYKLSALEPETLEEKWNFADFSGKGAYPHSGPSIGHDGTIYIGARDGNMYALHPETGKAIWDDPFFAIESIVFSQPVIDKDGTVYFGARDGILYAVNPDGSMKWQFYTGDKIDNSTPAIGSDGTLYIGSGDGCIYAIGK
jgi:outer membrane protein assembly factor BamB